MKPSVRVRFAPSPTGFLHIGGVRTALFNFLFARSQKGVFLVRIEDTDRERSRPEFEQEILDSLRWLGLNWDEPLVRQSERLSHYQKMADELVKKDLAYRDGTGGGGAVTFKNTPKKVKFDDLVHGAIDFDSAFFEDLVIQKSDGFPTYHFACVVDDHDMKITHVIRGDDHISNTPRQILLYEAFGWTPPEFGHLPLVFGPDKTPLSKRHTAVSLAQYCKDGFLPEAILNYLALLGWSPRTAKEMFSPAELQAEFSLEGVNQTNACFDLEKLKWLNAEHIRALGQDDYAARLGVFLVDSGFARMASEHNFRSVALLYRERIRTFREFPSQTQFFFSEKISFDLEAVRKYLRGDAVSQNLRAWREVLAEEGDFTNPAGLEALLRRTAEKLGIKAGDLIHPMRVAISGRSVTPGVFDVMSVLGRDRVLERLDYVVGHIQELQSK